MPTLNLGHVRFNNRGKYDAAASYVEYDVVTDDGQSYVCIENVKGTGPNDSGGNKYWEGMLLRGDDYNSARDQAIQAAGNADTSAKSAAAKAQNAANSKDGADASALEAKHWAQHPDNAPVPEGNGSEYSAKHWAEISRQRAVNAMVAQGAWDASTGSLPAEPSGASYWLVTGAANGVTVGGVEYRNKDMLLFTPSDSGGSWSKIDNTDSVASVAGKTGAVTLGPGDVGADSAGTAKTAVTAHEAKSSAHTPAQVGADPAGSAAAAKTHAVKRENHTGKQPLSTISDAGSAAAAAAERLANSPWCITGGSANEITLTTSYANAAPTTYRDGDQYRFQAAATNTGPATININGLGNKIAVTATGASLPAGYILTDTPATVTYSAKWDRMILERAIEPHAEARRRLLRPNISFKAMGDGYNTAYEPDSRIIFGSTIWNDMDAGINGVGYSSAAGLYYAPVTGWYHVYSTIFLNNSSAGSGRLVFKRNGKTFHAGVYGSFTATNEQSVHINTVSWMNPGDSMGVYTTGKAIIYLNHCEFGANLLYET